MFSTGLRQDTIYYPGTTWLVSCVLTLFFISIASLVCVSNFGIGQFSCDSFKNSGPDNYWLLFNCSMDNPQLTGSLGFSSPGTYLHCAGLLIIEFLLLDLLQKALIFGLFPWSTKESLDYRIKMSLSPCWFHTHEWFSLQPWARGCT